MGNTGFRIQFRQMWKKVEMTHLKGHKTCLYKARIIIQNIRQSS
jgi:hypothetical protein